MSCAHALDIVGKLTIDSSEDEVILPAHTYCASAIGFARSGAKLVWGDIDPFHLTLSFDEIVRLTTKNTKVILVVHLYGLICPDINKIAEFARAHNIVLVEDCAQCIGASLEGQYAGSFGDFSTFSFHAQKNMNTLGEGGMLAVAEESLDSRVRALRLNGHLAFENQQKYWLPAMTDVTNQSKNAWPMKATLTEAQSLVGRNVLKRLDEMNIRRKSIACQIVSGLDQIDGIRFQSKIESQSHCNHLLPLCIKSKIVNRDDFMQAMFSKFGIKCVTQYYPLYRYELFRTKGFASPGLEKTDDYYDNMVSLPFCHETTEAQADYIVNSVTRIFEGRH